MLPVRSSGRHHFTRYLGVLSTALLSTGLGCGSAYVPGTTLAGRYELNASDAVDVVELNGSGQYVHIRVKSNDTVFRERGTWTLDTLKDGTEVLGVRVWLTNYHY
jgi:hypothetical protein